MALHDTVVDSGPTHFAAEPDVAAVVVAVVAVVVQDCTPRTFFFIHFFSAAVKNSMDFG